jgi:hypothetical protein
LGCEGGEWLTKSVGESMRQRNLSRIGKEQGAYQVVSSSMVRLAFKRGAETQSGYFCHYKFVVLIVPLYLGVCVLSCICLVQVAVVLLWCYLPFISVCGKATQPSRHTQTRPLKPTESALHPFLEQFVGLTFWQQKKRNARTQAMPLQS